MNSAPIPESWRQAYLKRPVAKLPADVTAAWDRIRAQQRDIDTLRNQNSTLTEQVARWKIKYGVLTAMLGAAAVKGGEVAILALIKAFGH